MKFRKLYANEIDCRISTCSQYGVGLLLYKDARCDQNILDEVVGAMNWQRHHSRDNANCIVSIWDDEKKQWIEKEDTGTESYTEAEKGLASDSFKRACFNWGIGRELYTAPTMFVSSKDLSTLSKSDSGKWTCKDFFTVTEIEYEEDSIAFVRIYNHKTRAYIEFGTPGKGEREKVKKAEKAMKNYTNDPVTAEMIGDIQAELTRTGVALADILKVYKVDSIEKMTQMQYENCITRLKKSKAKGE